jgi:hypothetical protein
MGGVLMDYSAKDVYRTATQYYAASSAINEKLIATNNVGIYIAPWITNCALAIELYLKCLYFMDRGRKAPRNHDLNQLYRALGEENRITIKLFYDQFVGLDQTVQNMKSHYPETDLDLNIVLPQINKAFVNWRYNHEGNFTSFPTGGPLVQALKARIEMVNPDWRINI